MTGKKILLMICVFSYSAHAQFVDNLESYTDGEPIIGGHWTDLGCGGGPGCALMATSEVVHTGNLAGLIPDDGTTDAILDLGNKIFGHWRLEFWMYVPTGKEAYWSLKGCVPICTEDWHIHFFFNQNNDSPEEGYIANSGLGQIDFSFPHDEWFRVYMDWDITAGISLATWYLSIDNTDLIPYNTPYTNNLNEYPISLGGINFYSIQAGSNLYYLDNFSYCDEFDPPGPCGILALEDIDDLNIKIYPNPVSEALFIESKLKITSISMHTILGQEIYYTKMNTENYRIDMSSFTRGTYFVTVSVGDTQKTVKVIK